jgi:hypothetical protein
MDLGRAKVMGLIDLEALLLVHPYFELRRRASGIAFDGSSIIVSAGSVGCSSPYRMTVATGRLSSDDSAAPFFLAFSPFALDLLLLLLFLDEDRFRDLLRSRDLLIWLRRFDLERTAPATRPPGAGVFRPLDRPLVFFCSELILLLCLLFRALNRPHVVDLDFFGASRDRPLAFFGLATSSSSSSSSSCSSSSLSLAGFSNAE